MVKRRPVSCIFLSGWLALIVSCSSGGPSSDARSSSSASADSEETQSETIPKPELSHDCRSDTIYRANSPSESSEFSEDWCFAYSLLTSGLQKTGSPIDYESKEAFNLDTYRYADPSLTPEYSAEISKNLKAVERNRDCLPKPSENTPYCTDLPKSKFLSARSSVSGIYPLFAMDTNIRSLDPPFYSLRAAKPVKVNVVSSSKRSVSIQYVMEASYWPFDVAIDAPSDGPVEYQISGQAVVSKETGGEIKLDSGTYADAFLPSDPDRPVK